MLQELVVLYFLFLTTNRATDCSSHTIQLIGAGSSFPSAMYLEIGALYSTNRSLDRSINFFFDKVNSVYGKNRIKMTDSSLSPIVFAGAEVALSAAEKIKYPELLTFPVVAGALAIVYNIPKLPQINLTSTSIADIFMGKIEYWNDSSIQSANPTVQLPYKRISVVVRSDSGAGDTFIFTSALSKISQSWNQGFGIFVDPQFVDGDCCNSTKWPVHISLYGNRVTGLIGIVASIPYTIGYAAWPNTIGTGVTYAKIINHYGTLVEPNVDTVRSSMDYFLINASKDMRSDGLEYDLNNAKSETGYPFATFSYMIVNRTTHPNISSCQMQELAGFVAYLFNPATMAVISKYGLVPLSLKVTDFILHTIIPQITYQDLPVYKEFLASLIHVSIFSANIFIIGCAFAVVALLAVIAFGLYYRRNKLISETSWMLNGVKIRSEECQQSFTVNLGSMNSTTDFTKHSATKSPLLEGHWTRLQCNVILTEIVETKRETKQRKLLLNKFTKEIQHTNLLTFLGVAVINSRTFFVNQHCAVKGTLHDVLESCPFHIGDSIKANISCDILEGLMYLHKRNIVHGSLNSLECIVDTVWSVKIVHWELNSLRSVQKVSSIVSLLSKLIARFGDDDIILESKVDLVELLYLDPNDIYTQGKSTFHCDIFSYGVLLVEIYTRKLPYSQDVELALCSYSDVIKDKFKSKIFSPPMSISDIPLAVQSLVNQTLTFPAKQIDSSILYKSVKNIAGNKSVVDILMQSMENYMSQLEDKVAERTSELSSVTERMRDLLNDVLPKQIAMKLFQGQTVEPEFYECCTIFFSDIVGFTNISARSTPTQVMSFLNSLYTQFDKTIAKFDVYKVDTIGDAYMVASGLPARNGIEHPKQIGLMSLALLKAGSEFRIPHLPDEDLKIRMGFNSGPVTTGIIGNKMPQYCVFGDTVNTASRMESTSLPLKIQISEITRNFLVQYFHRFSLQLRGEIEIKGKGKMNTFWLQSYVAE